MNVYSYSEFLNEGWFGGSKYASVVKKIYNYIKNMSIQELQDSMKKKEYSEVDEYCKFTIKKHTPEDPYGEEDWENSVKVVIKLEDNKHYPSLSLNDDEIDITIKEARKLDKLIKQRIENKKQEEKEARLKKAIDRL